MNAIVNTFLLAGDKFMPEMHLRLIQHAVHLLNINKEFKNLCKQEILILFTEMN